MKNSARNTIRLGIFVMAGLLVLIVMLYLIGKNRNLFGANFILKARFENVHGLMPGNNVRFSGIEIGTVRSVNMINDTLIEVVMVVQTRMQNYIHKNAVVTIGTDGLVGNKIISIIPARSPAPLVKEGDVLQSRSVPSTDEMFTVLEQTNNDAAIIAAGLKTTVQRLNNSTGLWALLGDESISEDMRASLAHIRLMVSQAQQTMGDIHEVVAGVKRGDGTMGALLKDTGLAHNLNEAILKMVAVGNEADTLTNQIQALVRHVQHEVEQGNGPAHALLKDSAMVQRLNKSLLNIDKGSEAFNQNMEAMKHSFLLKGYFKKQEKSQKSETAQNDPPESHK